MSGRARAALLVCFVACAAFRLGVVHEFASSTPDGDQYLTLAASLQAGRGYTFDRAPTYARLPGFPMLLAAELPRGLDRDAKVRVVARWNATFDLVTALLAFGLVYAVTRSLGAALASGLGVVLSPLSILSSAMCLTENVATLLALAAVVAAYEAARRSSLWLALLAGALLGLGQLVRADLLTVAIVVLAVVASSAAWRRLVPAVVATTALVFAPWPIRNLIAFGAPHPTATEWLAQDGTPLPTGPIAWMRTWSDGAIGEQAYTDALVFGKRCGEPELVRPEMTDGADERARLLELTSACRRDGLTADVDARFRALARERFIAHPLRVLVSLPARRLLRLWWAPSAREIHWIKIPLLGLPGSYPLIVALLVALYALAAVGVASGVRTASRGLVMTCVALLATRSLLHAFAVPHQVGYRYWIEAWPIVAMLAGLGVLALLRRTRRG